MQITKSLTVGLTALAMILVAQTVPAQDGEATYGLSVFGPEELKYPADFEHFDYVNPDAPVGGTFSTGFGGVTYDSLNSFVLKGNPAIGMTLTYDTLMEGAQDEASSMYPLLAESAAIAEDGTGVTFVLNEAARFRDGSPVTADDVVWTFETLKEKGHPSYQIQFAAVISAKAEDARTVRFAFDPDAALRDLPTMVAGGLPVLQKVWWDERDFSDSTLDAPMGSGPYEVSRTDTGRSVTFKRRDDYWGWDLPVNRGRHNFDEIRIEYFRDRTASFEAFKSGAFTFNEEFWSKLWATAYSFPAIERGDVIKETIPDNRPAGTQGYWFNLRRDKFSDPRVRQAIAEVFDFEWSNRTLFHGIYERTDSFFEGGSMQASGAPTAGESKVLEQLGEALPPGVLESDAYVPPVTDGRGRNRDVLISSGALLEEAGWTLVDGVRKNSAGEPLEIEFLLTGEGFERITNPFIKNLKRLGIEANVRKIESSSYKQEIESFNFDIVVRRESMSLTPGVELRDIFHSAAAAQQGSDNITGIESEAVDRLIEMIERAESREELTDAVKALDRVLRAMHIWVPQWSKATHHIAYWDIFGRPDVKPEYTRGVIDLWWMDQDKYERLKTQLGG